MIIGSCSETLPRQDFSKESEASHKSIITSALLDDTSPHIICSACLISLFIYEGGRSLVFMYDSENIHWLSSNLEINFSLQTRAGVISQSKLVPDTINS